MTTRHHNWSSFPPSTVKVFHMDGRLQEFTQTIKASHLLSQDPNCFLCNSESMFIDSIVPKINEEEDLCLGQLYFLLPLSMSQVPLSLRELCILAVKASTALNSSSSLRRRKDAALSGASHWRWCRAPTGFDATRLALGESSRKI
ncbi:uncharacterized protein LOC104455406 [Eucalyptus grandis]|uniref:uncharacterized protein LOC104455406 n=1 Tax=Eucalyptus grandis TaxID=71139 RepID=UPI00192EEF25|nr:uncharacterized protein LOC104455406 [Eucalyptus grandis]